MRCRSESQVDGFTSYNVVWNPFAWTGSSLFSKREVPVPDGAVYEWYMFVTPSSHERLSSHNCLKASTAHCRYGAVNYSLIGPQNGQARVVLNPDHLRTMCVACCMLGCGVLPWSEWFSIAVSGA